VFVEQEVPESVELDGTIKALFVLARFPDEIPGSTCSPDPWPQSAEEVPSWAQLLLDDTDQPGEMTEGSLTHFFWTMSAGQHLLRGDVWDSVVVLDSLKTYLGSGGGGHGQATLDVIQHLDALPDSILDFSDYDWNDDGDVDFLFICYRQVYGPNGLALVSGITGNSGLTLPLGPFGDRAVVTAHGDTLFIPAGNGAELYPRTAERGPAITRGLAIHEYAHDLLSVAEANGINVPGNHIRSIGPYGVMDGTSARFHQGLLESVVRWKIGWMTPAATIEFTSAGQETTVLLTDVGANGGDGFLVVNTADPLQYFVLECRDSTATPYTDGSTLGGITACQVDGRGSSGLVIMHVSDHGRAGGTVGCCTSVRAAIPGWWEGESADSLTAPACDAECEDDCGLGGECCVNEAYPPTIDVEVATGMLDPDTWAPDPIDGFDAMSCITCEASAHQGSATDLFGNGQSNTFGPFTNPNTNLYWYDEDDEEYEHPSHCPHRRDQSVYSGLTFYNIHWDTAPGGGNGQMSVTIRYDGTSPPSAFATPAGMEWDGEIQLVGDVEVPSGRALGIAPGTQVVAAAGQDLLGADGHVGISVVGTLAAEGTGGSPVVLTSSRDTAFDHFLGTGEQGEAAGPGDWAGLRVGEDGDIEVPGAPSGGVSLRHASEAVAYSAGLWPDEISSLTFEGNEYDLTFDRDVVLLDATDASIPAGTTIGIAGSDAENAADGVDEGRVELILQGTATLDFGGTGGSPVVVSSKEESPVAGDWYGVRTPDIDHVEGGHVSLQHARGALALEDSLGVFPDLDDLTTRGFTFADNVSDVSFDRDITIASNTVSIDEGWRIGFRANEDDGGHGFSSLLELIVSGDAALVTDGTSQNRVSFVSDNPTPGSSAEWGGIRFDLMGSIDPTYGYMGSYGVQSRLEGVTIKNAEAGIGIETGVAPSLVDIVFADNRADILLDSTSVYIPYGYCSEAPPPAVPFNVSPAVWSLAAPTRVVATNAAIDSSWSIGTAGKVDLVVHGKLYTSSSDTTKVIFESQAKDAETGADWGGIMLTKEAAGSVLSAIDIGYAANPIFMAYPDSGTTLEGSHIHHFSDTGVWVYGAFPLGGVISNNLIERGQGLGSTVGTRGMLLDRGDEMRVLGNQIDLSGLDLQSGSAVGMEVYYGKTHCDASVYGDTDSLLVEGNYVTGPGLDPQEGTYSGIRFDWVCGSDDRAVTILENVVTNWKTYGLELLQDSDVQISCNRVRDTNRPVHISRDSGATGPAVRFRYNELRLDDQSGDVFRTNKAAKTKLGGWQSDRGKNDLLRPEQGGWWITESDASDDSLAADYNRWYQTSGQTATLVTVADSVLAHIRTELASDTTDVDVVPLETNGEYQIACLPSLTPPAAMRAAGPRTRPAGEQGRPEAARTSEAGAQPGSLSLPPERSYLGPPVPTPTRGGILLDLGVGRTEGGLHTVRIYDVRGALVRKVTDEVLPPGRYRLTWNGRNEAGRLVAPGVYFLRMQGPGIRELRKVTIVR